MAASSTVCISKFKGTGKNNGAKSNFGTPSMKRLAAASPVDAVPAGRAEPRLRETRRQAWQRRTPQTAARRVQVVERKRR